MILTLLAAIHLTCYAVLCMVLLRIGIPLRDYWIVVSIVLCIGTSGAAHGILWGRRYSR